MGGKFIIEIFYVYNLMSTTYYQKHKDKIKERNLLYYKEHKAEINIKHREYCKQYYVLNHERILRRRKDNYKYVKTSSHKEYLKEYYKENRDKIRKKNTKSTVAERHAERLDKLLNENETTIQFD